MRYENSTIIVDAIYRQFPISMSLRESIVEDFNRTPLTITIAVFGLVVSALSLLVAWIQYAGAPLPGSISLSVGTATANFKLANLWLVMSFSLACTVTFAWFIHAIDRAYPFPAMVLSIPAAILSAFLSLLVFKLVPPRPITTQILEQAQDLVYWSTLFIFLAINGRSAVMTTSTDKQSEAPQRPATQAGDAIGSIALLLLMLAIWGSLVSAGISRLLRIFLV